MVTKHKTFPWHLAILRIALESSFRPLKPCSKVPRDDDADRLARKALGDVRVQFTDHDVIADPRDTVRELRTSLGSEELFERVAYALIADIGIHLKNAEEAAAGKGRRRVLQSVRRSPRKRHLLSDPDLPAWAGVNRMPSKKVQMPCRVEPDIKKMIEVEAAEAKVSQSRWLEEAIAEKLQRQGHPIYLPAPVKVAEGGPKPPRRTKRARLPEPSKSRNAAANRRGKGATLRTSEALAAHIDNVRGEADRSAWVNEAVQAALDNSARLPIPRSAKQSLSVTLSLRFDPEVFDAIERSAHQTGLTKSEWLRRVCAWKVAQGQ